MEFKCENVNALDVLKEMFYLAYEASGVYGMGCFQAKSSVTKEDVYENVCNEDDYPSDGSTAKARANNGYYYADYVFGRMMKLGLRIKEDNIVAPDMKPRSDYQSWCRVFSTYEDLFKMALTNILEESKKEI